MVNIIAIGRIGILGVGLGIGAALAGNFGSLSEATAGSSDIASGSYDIAAILAGAPAMRLRPEVISWSIFCPACSDLRAGGGYRCRVNVACLTCTGSWCGEHRCPASGVARYDRQRVRPPS